MIIFITEYRWYTHQKIANLILRKNLYILWPLEVIRGHQRSPLGSKPWNKGKKSETRPNTHDMHTIRLEIFLWIQWYSSRGHPRSSYGVKKGHLGSKIENTAKCTWYTYHSIGNFLRSSFLCISRSSEVILWGQKRSFGVKILKYAKMHKICISFDRDFFWIQCCASRGHSRSF